MWFVYNLLEVWPKFEKEPEWPDQPWQEQLWVSPGQLARPPVASVWDWAAEAAVGLIYSPRRVCLCSKTGPRLPKAAGDACVAPLGVVGVPVFAVLDALTQRSSLVEGRVSTAAGTGGQDAVLERETAKLQKQLNKDRHAASGQRRAPELTVEGVALFLRSAEATGLAGTFVVELPDEPFLPESSAAVLLSALLE